jgi:putative membrane protein
MTDRKSQRRPRAFRLDEGDVAMREEPVEIEPQPDHYEAEAARAAPDADERAVEVAQRRGLIGRGLSWSGVFWSALGALASLAIGVWIDGLIEGFFARSAALGWIGVVLLALIGVCLVALLARELGGLFRQRGIARMHIAFANARAGDDRDAARALVRDLCALQARRPASTNAREKLLHLTREIVDGRDLIDIAERELVHPLDEEARREIATAAKRVSLVTAISPRALIDVLFVVAQSIRLVRRIAEIYGGRPGWLGFIRLARSVGAHLAITGGMAVGDSIVQQALGHGIAARISARLGEGVLNGMLTTRVGLSAMAVCRPLPFAVERPPGVKDVAPFLFGGDKKD